MSTNVEQVCAWVSLVTFISCIICVIFTPRIPIFIHWKRIQNFITKKRTQLKPVQLQIEQELDEEKNTPQEDIELDIDIVETPNPSSPTPDPLFHWFTLDMATAPIISLLFLFATTCLSWDVFVSGIVGDDKIRPYGVIILFMSLSYVCISLDITGIFEHFAQVIIVKSKSRGHLLFIFFAIFASVLTLFTSNDIVILTLTPICCYLSKNAKNLDLVPFVICQFFLANIWSVAFQIGNPTNMIVAEAYNMNFLNYFLWMGLPAFVAGITSFIVLYAIFYRRIPHVIMTENVEDNQKPLKDKKSAIIKSIGLFICLVVLAIASVIPLQNGNTIPAFLICLSFFILFLIYDIMRDVVQVRKEDGFRAIRYQLPNLSTTKTLVRMPWSIVPFVFGMFVMVELLNNYGFVTLIATGLQQVITGISQLNSESSLLSIIVTCYTISIISTLACNVLNNQPMTILFTKVLTSPAYVPNEVLQQASSFSLILGSNLGANVTLIGALAGIMWIHILRNNGVDRKDMNYFKFLMYGILVTPVALFASTAIIALEVYIMQINKS